MPHEQTPVHTSDAGQPAVDPKTRKALLRLLAGVPGIAEAVRSATAGQTFRAVMSETNAHLFKQAPDGFHKMGLHDGRHIVENVKLKAVSPDYAKSVADLSLSMSLAAILAKLDAIQAGIGEIEKLVSNTFRYEALGALAALASASALSDPIERRHHMLARCLDAETALGKLVGQLRSHVRAMPGLQTRWLALLHDDGLAKASTAYAEVRQDMAVFAKGVRELMHAFQEVDEPEMAKAWMRQIAARLDEAALSDAIAKARLVPMPAQGLEPAEQLALFLPLVADLSSQALGAGSTLLTIEFDPKELQA